MIHLTEDGTEMMAEKIQDILNNEYIPGEAYAEGRGVVVIEIEWGNMEHDHNKIDYIVNNKFHPNEIDIDITADNGTDTYSATHYYYF